MWATATNITAKIIIDTIANQNHPKSLESLKQLVVVPNADNLEGYVEADLYRNHPAAFVPSKVPNRRTPPYMNILIHEHHVTPHMQKVNLMTKFNTLLDQDLNEIEKFLDIDI